MFSQHVTDLVKKVRQTGVPVIYFGTDSATLLTSMKGTGADVIGLDWRIPLDEGWRALKHDVAVQGNLDPVVLFADWKEVKSRAELILRQAAGRPGHIFNLGHGILPETPVQNVKDLGTLCESARHNSSHERLSDRSGHQLLLFGGGEVDRRLQSKSAVLLLAHGSPETADEIPDSCNRSLVGVPCHAQVIEEVTHRYSLIGFSPLTCWTRLQADRLSQFLDLPVYVGMRNWKPYIADVVKQIASEGRDRVVSICLAPQNSRTSVGLYRSAVVGDSGLSFTLDFVESWHDNPLLARAFAEKFNAGWTKACAEPVAKCLSSSPRIACPSGQSLTAIRTKRNHTKLRNL